MRALLTGDNLLNAWLIGFVAVGIIAGVVSGFFKARKIQPSGFKWKQFRFEAIVAVITITISGALLGGLNGFLKRHGIIAFNHGPAAWWQVAIEYVAYFLLFDTWFYWLHRGMHREPFYRLIHKLHHKSTAPNVLTTLSVNPLESFINGGFVPLFLSVFTVHDATMALIGPTNILMGLYVHSGYEFLPRWWNKSWATKWFITTTFHDQHHKYFNWNFGGYTPVWDYLCGTVRKKYEADFDKIKTRSVRSVADAGEPQPAA
ncbi:MAG: sterol desaturase family protein [Novosphingobium sp.]|nr:sterol desaturase family protein [Novosphingobium sp.]